MSPNLPVSLLRPRKKGLKDFASVCGLVADVCNATLLVNMLKLDITGNLQATKLSLLLVSISWGAMTSSIVIHYIGSKFLICFRLNQVLKLEKDIQNLDDVQDRIISIYLGLQGGRQTIRHRQQCFDR